MMNAQISFLEGTFSLIHVPLHLYSSFLHPILQVLLPQSPGCGEKSGEALTVDKQHGFLNISITPIECSIVCHTSWVRSVWEPAIKRLPKDTTSRRGVTVSKDMSVFSVISAGMDAGSRVVDLTSPLALAGISIFFITTYYSDFILVPTKDRQSVVTALLARGFEFSEDEAAFKAAGPQAHSRAGSQSSEPPSTPPPSSVGELQVRTFEQLTKRNVTPYVEDGLRLIHCSGRESSSIRGYSGRPSFSRTPTGNGTRTKSWVDTVDTKLYTSVVSALVSQPRFLSITLAQEDPPSLLLDKELLNVFGDSLVGPTEGTLVPIFLDLDNLPFEATGIVSGVAGKLVQDMQMMESAELSYLSTARAGAVILSEEQSVRALAVLKSSLVKEG
ncbi:ACT domain-containing protein [Podospora aff. communis PSN243]|uniref:ACT domain-containing protein n=1 Tax=Podospora aff. communis PSN243 TaxID=3040156 RepID=A0AAV9H127_9PEZI|nr:ACT domain-containing protein [Podospora aff. communis PSN243]